ncbi:MAG TPA: glycoside hydrolase family 3 N-terminal domain-containing protein [Candidatus Dojkabacteria bacterium]
MKKKSTKIAILAIIILIIFLSTGIGFYLYIKTPAKASYTRLREFESFAIDVTQLKISTMSLEEKQGLLTMVGIPDKILSQSTIDFLKDNHIGGVVLLANNIESESQLKQLTKDLRNKVDKNLLIAIDQEGGLVTRINWDPYKSMSARDIGDSGDLELAYKIGFERGVMLLEYDINVILGPVADIAYERDSFIYERSFGSDPEKVADFVEATVKGQREAGIITVLKHFPGHGKTSTDSHLRLPIIDASLEELKTSDFLPFERGIAAGAEVIMFGHIINPQIDPDTPSSISTKYLDILMNDLSFNGVVITDDLKMSGGIDGSIGWGINLYIESTDKYSALISRIVPEDEYLYKVVNLRNKKGM